MFAKLAAHHMYSLGKDRDEHYDFDHAMNFRALVTYLTEPDRQFSARDAGSA
jgi:hypothetical protein